MLAKALLWLLPAVTSHSTAQDYAKLIQRYVSVDHLLVAAVIYVESRGRAKARSRTNDWGLLQVHVSRTANPGYRGRESELLSPQVNIRVGARSLAAWRRYHEAHCRGKRHHWIGHYNQGTRVRSRHYERTVLALYRRLVARYRSAGES